jgi:dihydroorotate dehydrogenase
VRGGRAAPIIADGGVREDKDVFLALVAGASVVMLGAFSGTDEAPGQIIETRHRREAQDLPGA